MQANTDYEQPGHPLYGVPQRVLDAARSVLAGAASEQDVDSEMADPIADAVVIEVLPVIRRWLANGSGDVPDDGFEYGIEHRASERLHRTGMTKEEASAWMTEDWEDRNPWAVFRIVRRPASGWTMVADSASDLT